MAEAREKMFSKGHGGTPVMPRRRSFPHGLNQDHGLKERQELVLLRQANARLRREVAALKGREAEAQRRADRDGLTGLYNHRRMLQLTEAAIKAAAAQRQCVGLLFIDLNGFKEINDGYGHAVGDTLLTTAAARIAARVRAGDFVCRYGGDEFVVILPNVPHPAAVARVADAIRERLALPHWIEGREQRLTAAVGESLYPRDGTTVAELMRRADQDMYRLKARSSRPIVSFGGVPAQRPSRRRSDA